ncbi:tetratricopeptide repeat protein [Streptomyces sp. NBC_00247]|uniref:tetratricopeptide repeat protein n=1 Tax=Streptomyces sp. NBC_00247 TaxID=2975689 RepID=UPI002E298E3C|nr:tetratricopeptide repeat protein [Streptomyces sp. NBC_00247]
MALFTENLSKDPQSEEDPADFLFHVRGVGGVGKSTLLRQWQEAARRADAATAVVDENDVHGVRQALTELARQLAAQGGPCKDFDKAVEQFRREQATHAEPTPAEGEASVSSRVVTQAALGAVSLIPGAGVVTAMANPDAAAQGLDRIRSASRSRQQRRGGRGDETGLSRAFVAELERLCRRQRWVVLFFDTWEQTAQYLDGWLLSLLDEEFGPVPANLVVVLAGRDELPEREWAPLRDEVADVPLEVFTATETRSLLTSRGVTDTSVVEAVLQLSMGLPLLVELLALARPDTVEDVDAGGDIADVAVERFVQWITDPDKRDAVRACALPLQLNEDIFAAAAGPAAEPLWEWLCGQPFVNGRSGYKHYHAVVRASMIRQQRTHSPQGWASAHARLAETHAAWRAAVEERLPEAKRWEDPTWRRHRLDETYHRLCAHPGGTGLPSALEHVAHAAGQDSAVLRQWVEALEQAAQDAADSSLLHWSGRLRDALNGDDPALACLGVLLSHDRLSAESRSWAYTYRGIHLYLCDRDEEALSEFDRAIAHNDLNAHAWARRGETHRWLDHHDQAVADLTAALELDPTYDWALTSRGQAHTQAGRYDQAITDLTAALELDPTYTSALASRGETHRLARRYDQAITDLTAALELDPIYAWALASRGQTHRQAGRYDQAITDLTAALGLDPTYAWALASRGQTHRLAGRYDQAVTDLTAALELNPTYAWALAERGESHRLAGRYDEAVTDFTAALGLDHTYAWALASRGQTHRQAGRYDQAITDLTAALELNPTYAWALAARGETHRLAGRYDEAVTDFTAALGLDHTYAWALASRGQTHRQAGRYDQAITDLTAALELNPTYAWALAARGETHRLAGRYDEAVTDFTAALGLDHTYAWALASRGQTHRQAGRYDQAITDLTAALELNPTYAWALAARGETHRQAGRYDQAIADFTAALELNPAYAWALASRGQAQIQAGRYDQAVADLTDALELNPTYAWALAARSQAHRQAGHLDKARADMERAAETHPGAESCAFERLMLETVEGRFEACTERWRQLLAASPSLPDEAPDPLSDLFRRLLFDTESSVREATEELLATHPGRGEIADLLTYLVELFAVADGVGDRARQCHDQIVEHSSA